MATKRLVKKSDTFVSVKKDDLFPFANKLFTECTIDKYFVVERIEEELNYAQKNAKSRLVGLDESISVFERNYAKNPSIGGFYLTGGGIPFSYKYFADTTKLMVIWCDGEIRIDAFRMKIRPREAVKTYDEYSPTHILKVFDKHSFINVVYREYFKSLGIDFIDIPENKYIAELLKHKQENIFIARLKYFHDFDYFQENIIFNGKEFLPILPKTSKSTVQAFEEKISIKRFFEFVRFFTNYAGAVDILYDFLNQKISAEEAQMYLYV
jgi:hypothetical protein